MVYHKKYLKYHGAATLSVAGRWMESLEGSTDWIAICDKLDMLSTLALCKIAFDLDVPFNYQGDEAMYKMIGTCFSGIKDKLFNPFGCTVSGCFFTYIVIMNVLPLDPTQYSRKNHTCYHYFVTYSIETYNLLLRFSIIKYRLKL